MATAAGDEVLVGVSRVRRAARSTSSPGLLPMCSRSGWKYAAAPITVESSRPTSAGPVGMYVSHAPRRRWSPSTQRIESPVARFKSSKAPQSSGTSGAPIRAAPYSPAGAQKSSQ